MSDSAPTSTPNSPAPGAGLPPGDHPLEIAARRGFGPLSPKAQSVWHGNAMPCVTCGELVHREDLACEHCDQDLSEEMLAKMRTHAGPWYVLEHVRPFPGVTLELIIRQIQRGLITETSIIRGPATDYQWRFAVETPGLCRYFGRCWKCHTKVTSDATYCADCLSLLDMVKPRAQPRSAISAAMPSDGTRTAVPPATGAVSTGGEPGPIPRQTMRDSLSELTAAMDEADVTRRDDLWDEPPRVGPIRATWIAIILLILTILALIWIASARTPRATILEATPARQNSGSDGKTIAEMSRVFRFDSVGRPSTPGAGAKLSLSLLNHPTPVVRTRMPGGVGGGGHAAPSCPDTPVVPQTFGLLDLVHHV